MISPEYKECGLTEDCECGSAPGVSGAELHVSAHIGCGLSEGQSVDRAQLLQQDSGAGLEHLSIQSPHRSLLDRDRHLTLETGLVRCHDLQVTHLPDQEHRLG